MRDNQIYSIRHMFLIPYEYMNILLDNELYEWSLWYSQCHASLPLFPAIKPARKREYEISRMQNFVIDVQIKEKSRPVVGWIVGTNQREAVFNHRRVTRFVETRCCDLPPSHATLDVLIKNVRWLGWIYLCPLVKFRNSSRNNCFFSWNIGALRNFLWKK